MGPRQWSLASGAALLALALAAGASAQGGGFPAGQATIERILVHIDRGSAHATFPVYRDLARALSKSVHVTATVAVDLDADGARELLAAAGFEPHRVELIVADGPITPWARDRVIALQGAPPTLLTPSPACVGLERLGDLQSAHQLTSRGSSSRLTPTDLWLEGGNVLFDRGRALVGSQFVALQSLEAPVTEAEALGLLRSYLGDVLLVGESERVPHDHLDMFATVVGERTMLLGDPRQSLPFLTKSQRDGFAGCLLPDFDVWSPEAQRSLLGTYALIEEQLTRAGVAVYRIPIVHGDAGGILTWNNAIVERIGGETRAYVPVYGVPRLDGLALAAYRRAGCVVFPIDASRVVSLGGAVRCLVNVIGWRAPEAGAAAPASPELPAMRTQNR